MRLFYILKPNGENDVIKFGIAGQNEGSSASWGRLHSYINVFGVADDLNRCKGIRLLYLAGNVYNPKVEVKNTDVFKKELACKRFFRNPDNNGHMIGRGFERIKVERLPELFAIMENALHADYTLRSCHLGCARSRGDVRRKTPLILYVAAVNHGENGMKESRKHDNLKWLMLNGGEDQAKMHTHYLRRSRLRA